MEEQGHVVPGDGVVDRSPIYAFGDSVVGEPVHCGCEPSGQGHVAERACSCGSYLLARSKVCQPEVARTRIRGAWPGGANRGWQAVSQKSG